MILTEHLCVDKKLFSFTNDIYNTMNLSDKFNKTIKLFKNKETAMNYDMYILPEWIHQEKHIWQNFKNVSAIK